MPRILAALVVAFFMLNSALPAVAATSGLVRGVVTVEGKPMAGVKVTLEGEGSRFRAASDAEGNYVFSQVPFGRYAISAQYGEFPVVTAQIVVNSGSVVRLDLAISKLKTIEVVSATGHAGANASAPSVHQIDRTQIQTSPVQESLDKTLETIPGVIQFSYNEPVINGFHGVTYNIDGAPLPLATTSNFAEIIDPKNIDSIEILTGAIPAEYGGDRMGGVVNIITNRPTDVPEGVFGTVTGGIGNQAQGLGSVDLGARFGQSEAFLNANVQSNNRGLDAPTFDAIHDNTSQADQFFRFITQLDPRASLSFDYSNQLAQFQIPINVDPNNPYDPIWTPAGTDDVQREYDRFSHLTFTENSQDGNGVFTVIPWYRSTRVDYDGDLYNDVIGLSPNFGASGFVHNVGLLSSTYANYIGLRMSDFRATKNHAWKIGLDTNRENLSAFQDFACWFPNCAATGKHDQPYYLIAPPQQAQAGSQVGLYAEDKWQMGQYVVVNYGLRYDHSTGYTSGNMIEPRVGVTLWDGGANTLHAYYGRFYAAPLLEDIRQDCVLLSGCSTTLPVYDLKPENDSYFEMGIAHAFNQDLTGSLNVFAKTVVNILDTSQLLNTPIFAVYNNQIGNNHGAELSLKDRMPNDDNWFLSMTYSDSLAACISGSTFLFSPNPVGISCQAQLAPEDHSQLVDATAGYTWVYGLGHQWYSTLQANYGSGFPVAFEYANTNLSGTLPAHTTFDLALGRFLKRGHGSNNRGLAPSLIIENLLDHQYPIKVANGFNTTQIANGRTVLFRLQAPF